MPRKKSVDSASGAGSSKTKKKSVRGKKKAETDKTEEIVSIPPETPETGMMEHKELKPMYEPLAPASNSATDQQEEHNETESASKADGFKIMSASSQPEPHHEESVYNPMPEPDHHEEHSHTGELLETQHDPEAEPRPQTSMADIKPKSYGSDYFQNEGMSANTGETHDLLMPDKFSFDLKPGIKAPEQKDRAKTVRTLTILLSGLVVLAAGALIFLNVYSQHLLNQTAVNAPAIDANQQQAQNQQQAAAKPKLALVNAADPAKTVIANAMSKQQTVNFDQGASITLPTATTDTLYIKNANADQTKAVTDLLRPLGIVPKIQQKSDLADDYALYLASTLSSPDLSNLTAAVYNSGSTPGLAKKYCDALAKDKVTSCNSLNATLKQSTFTVATNSAAAIVNLSRTSIFKGAAFVAAANGQVEDIRVTTNK